LLAIESSDIRVAKDWAAAATGVDRLFDRHILSVVLEVLISQTQTGVCLQTRGEGGKADFRISRHFLLLFFCVNQKSFLFFLLRFFRLREQGDPFRRSFANWALVFFWAVFFF
jgi:hypothetical protein